jgi:hypothetical protein
MDWQIVLTGNKNCNGGATYLWKPVSCEEYSWNEAGRCWPSLIPTPVYAKQNHLFGADGESSAFAYDIRDKSNASVFLFVMIISAMVVCKR